MNHKFADSGIARDSTGSETALARPEATGWRRIVVATTARSERCIPLSSIAKSPMGFGANRAQSSMPTSGLLLKPGRRRSVRAIEANRLTLGSPPSLCRLNPVSNYIPITLDLEKLCFSKNGTFIAPKSVFKVKLGLALAEYFQAAPT
jgi:hypothetical protein